tara:strand:+ start:369 stop:569 length:201 start_codon:yes stop_codon:yes gene_type:complete
MIIDEEILQIEKEKLNKDFDMLKAQITKTEIELGSMKSNLNALHGAVQQTDKLIAMSKSNKDGEKK